MKKIYLLAISALAFSAVQSQNEGLPAGWGPGEQENLPAYRQYLQSNARAGITTPPGGNLRTMAEWEELQGLFITWTGFPSILGSIVKAAQTETTVYIHCSDSNAVKTALQSQSVPLTNIKYLEVPFNSIWMRDYGGNSVYKNDVDSLLLVDWIYNRPRPDDDAIPEFDAAAVNIPFYQTYQAPADYVNTGGNWMSDGFGTAFASKLMFEDNGVGNSFSVTVKDDAQVNAIASDFMGINTYIKMETLPYDGIHHIDMHMKLIDEETLLIAEYPTGVADGPQIETNMLYVLDNFTSKWGTQFKVIRIPSPPSTGGAYPDNNGSYRTYTNNVFVNKTVIMPGYREEYDTIALRIMKKALPGYKIVMIDCDNSGNNIISQSGAIHCITHSIGVNDPLLISHQPLNDTYQTTGTYSVNAYINHKTGIADAKVYYRIDTLQAYQSVNMTLTNAATHTWTGEIPAQAADSKVYYYVEANSVNGKHQVRPMPAPAGWWKFNVLKTIVGLETEENVFTETVFPNPASAITCVPVKVSSSQKADLYITDVNGKKVKQIYSGTIPQGQTRYYFNASDMASGVYFVVFNNGNVQKTQKLLVK